MCLHLKPGLCAGNPVPGLVNNPAHKYLLPSMTRGNTMFSMAREAVRTGNPDLLRELYLSGRGMVVRITYNFAYMLCWKDSGLLQI